MGTLTEKDSLGWRVALILQCAEWVESHPDWATSWEGEYDPTRRPFVAAWQLDSVEKALNLGAFTKTSARRLKSKIATVRRATEVRPKLMEELFSEEALFWVKSPWEMYWRGVIKETETIEKAIELFKQRYSFVFNDAKPDVISLIKNSMNRGYVAATKI